MKERVTITLDTNVLEGLKKRADRENTNISSLSNFILKMVILPDPVYFNTMAKFHCRRMNMFKEMEEISLKNE